MFKKNSRFQIKTPTGFENFVGVQKKFVDTLYTIELEDGTYLKCSGNHAILCETGFIFAKDLTLSNTLTNKVIKNITHKIGKFEVFDPVGVDKHKSYFSNGIVSHNTEFLGSSNTLISGAKLQMMAYVDPIWSKDLFDVYEQPIKGNKDETTKDHLYVMTVDIAEGRGLDASAFSIFDVSTTPYKQVAKYKSSSISPVLFPTVIYNAARLYNNAYVLIEINNTPQIADILHSDMEYENILKVQTGNKKAQQLSAGFARGVQLGVKMSTQVKRIGCSNLKTLIESDKLFINDFDTISELTTFVANNTTFAADEDSNDDMVMTLVLFAWLTTNRLFKDIVNHDVRKQLQLEQYNQVDDEMLPIGEISDGLDSPFFVEDGDVWETTSGSEVYSGYFKDFARNI
jgi:hypothetical protein